MSVRWLTCMLSSMSLFSASSYCRHSESSSSFIAKVSSLELRNETRRSFESSCKNDVMYIIHFETAGRVSGWRCGGVGVYGCECVECVGTPCAYSQPSSSLSSLSSPSPSPSPSPLPLHHTTIHHVTKYAPWSACCSECESSGFHLRPICFCSAGMESGGI